MPHKLYLIRHGETEWSLSGQHTGLTDIPLTEGGKEQAKALSKLLQGHIFKKVYTSPLIRAKETCALAGLLPQAVVSPEIVEWNYGKYEGLTHPEIRALDPHWTIFTKGAPGGESPEEVALRADRFLSEVHKVNGDVAIFSHGHFLRSLTARYLQLPITQGKSFALYPASLSILGHERTSPAILLWNQISRLS